jgi:hypothetical protein
MTTILHKIFLKFPGGDEERGRKVAVLALLALVQASARSNQAVRSGQTLEGFQGQREGKGERKAERKKVKSKFLF